ncbi:hypothetical protein GQ42DRAFT_52012 [Ramicandelaber brevisporus]|nr:hypothetical protein GQ42DRAFT_52012 [Ramicandelaber brevisporus]
MPRGARPHPLDIPSTPTVSMMPLAIGAGSGGEPRTPTGVTSSMSTIPISQSNSNAGGGTLTSPSGVISLKLTIPSSQQYQQQQQQQQHPSTEKVGTTIATTIATTTSNGGILSPASSGFNRSALVSASGNSSLIFNRTTPPMMSDISAWPTAPATPVVSMNAMGNVFASMSDFRPPVMMAALPPPPPAMSDSSCATAVDDTASDMTRVAYCTRARVSPAIVTQIPMSNKTIKRRSTVISGDELSRYQRKMEEALATGVPPTSSMATTAAAVAQFEPYVGNHVAIGGHGNLGLNMNPVALSSLKSGSNNTMGLTARHVRLKSVY